MLIKKYFILLCSLICFSSYALTLTDLQAQLATQQLVRGQYTQVKTMRMFKQPLRSQGEFLLQQQQGLLWLQKQPFAINLVLTKDKLSQQFAGQPAQVVNAADNPMIFYFSHLFLSLFKGDLEGLIDQFEMQLEDKNGQWSLQLLPKNAPLNKVFKEINIFGDKYINKLQLIELNGDSSVIEFIGQNSLPNTLSEYEQHYFQF